MLKQEQKMDSIVSSFLHLRDWLQENGTTRKIDTITTNAGVAIIFHSSNTTAVVAIKNNDFCFRLKQKIFLLPVVSSLQIKDWQKENPEWQVVATMKAGDNLIIIGQKEKDF